MNRDEAIKVLEIMKQADGGCPSCVSELIKKFRADFPKFQDIADNYEKKYGD